MPNCRAGAPPARPSPARSAGSKPVPKLFPRLEPTGAGFPIATSRVCGDNHGKGSILATPAMERRPQPLLHRFARRSRQSSSPTPAAASNHAPRAVAPTPDAAPLACAKSSSRTPHQPSAVAPPLRSVLRAASTWIAPKPSRPAPARPRAPTPATLWRRPASGSPAPEPTPHLLLRAARPSARLQHLPRALHLPARRSRPSHATVARTAWSRPRLRRSGFRTAGRPICLRACARAAPPPYARAEPQPRAPLPARSTRAATAPAAAHGRAAAARACSARACSACASARGVEREG
jgi:hypothetical protein